MRKRQPAAAMEAPKDLDGAVVGSPRGPAFGLGLGFFFSVDIHNLRGTLWLKAAPYRTAVLRRIGALADPSFRSSLAAPQKKIRSAGRFRQERQSPFVGRPAVSNPRLPPRRAGPLRYPERVR